MPSWTDENGKDYFGLLQCKMCLTYFKYDEKTGEVPAHKCIDGELWTSAYVNGTCHDPVKVEKIHGK